MNTKINIFYFCEKKYFRRVLWRLTLPMKNIPEIKKDRSMERLMDSNLSWYWSLLSSTPHCDIDRIPTPRENRLEATDSVRVCILGCHSPVPLAKPLWLGFLTGWRCRLLVPGLRSSVAVVVLAEPLECLCVLGVQSIKQTDVSYLEKKRRYPT